MDRKNNIYKWTINYMAKTRRYFARFMAFLLYFLTSSRSLFYKRNWHPDPDKMVLQDTDKMVLQDTDKMVLQDTDKMVLQGTSLPSSQLPGFPNTVAIPCLNTSSPDLLACCAASRTSLDSVTSITKRLHRGFKLGIPKSKIIFTLPPHPTTSLLPQTISHIQKSTKILNL